MYEFDIFFFHTGTILIFIVVLHSLVIWDYCGLMSFPAKEIKKGYAYAFKGGFEEESSTP